MEKEIRTYYAKSVVSIIDKCGCIRFYANTKGHSYYTTDDAKTQKRIEDCILFKDGKIVVTAVEAVKENEELGIENGELKIDNASKNEELGIRNEESANSYGDVTKCVDAIAILRELGVEGSLTSKAKILEAAKAKGVEFPNL